MLSPQCKQAGIVPLIPESAQLIKISQNITTVNDHEDIDINEIMPKMDIVEFERENQNSQMEFMTKQPQKTKQAAKKVRLHNKCEILIMNIKEKQHDWSKNGIASKTNSTVKLCELLKVQPRLSSIESMIFMKHHL